MINDLSDAISSQALEGDITSAHALGTLGRISPAAKAKAKAKTKASTLTVPIETTPVMLEA